VVGAVTGFTGGWVVGAKPKAPRRSVHRQRPRRSRARLSVAPRGAIGGGLGSGGEFRGERVDGAQGVHHLRAFAAPAFADRKGAGLHPAETVLNLVEGAEAIVESPSGAFAPFIVHYAETFIVPASVGAYTIRPHGQSVGKECATLKAFIRVQA